MERLSARKCTIEVIENATANGFLMKHHSQGALKSNLKAISLGLFFDSRLVGVAQFGSPRTSAMKRSYSTELYRLGFITNLRVAGGASKLIKSYIREFNPADIFTYQDTSGEATKVYDHSGFTLVRGARPKKVLVIANKTAETASRRDNEVFSIETVARLGPDILLGTNLKEVRHDDDRRKTNIELFQDLGWTIELVPGDRVYEWMNPNTSFYTYRITASDSDKYYIGVRRLKVGNASIADCLDDPYMGSGGNNAGNKFRNWKSKHSNNLLKEILSIFDRKSTAYKHEQKIIGDLWKTDSKCLNSRPGGVVTGFSLGQSLRYSKKHCEVHGETTFSSTSCVKCLNETHTSMKICERHGRTHYIGEKCRKCFMARTITLIECPEHGEVKHQGGTCMTCTVISAVKVKECSTHGLTKFQGDRCSTCTNESLIQVKECPTHGLVKHRVNTCMKCAMAAACYEEVCEIHGKTTYRANSCVKCTNLKSISLRNCSKHGVVKHIGNVCYSCNAESNITIKTCSIHGESKHIGAKCFKCRAPAIEANCSVHGMTAFRKNTCLKCAAKAKSYKTKTCSVCDAAFAPKSGRQKTCSEKCGLESKKKLD